MYALHTYTPYIYVAQYIYLGQQREVQSPGLMLTFFSVVGVYRYYYVVSF